MKSRFTATVLAALLAGPWLSAPLQADDLAIYPKSDQSPEQQEKDQFECYGWAKDDSGFDPMAPPRATEQPPQQQAPQGGVLRGAARGAAVGAIIDDSEGAKKGAWAGAAVGGMRRQDQKRKEAQAHQQWEQQQQQIYAENRNRYNRAYSACLEARDYIVK